MPGNYLRTTPAEHHRRVQESAVRITEIASGVVSDSFVAKPNYAPSTKEERIIALGCLASQPLPVDAVRAEEYVRDLHELSKVGD